MRPDARYVVEWTRAQLDAAQIDFLASLPMMQRHADQLYVHANAWAPAGWAYILGRGEAVKSLGATDCRYTFCGHVHEPRLYHLSAGQPRDGNPAACYAMLDEAEGTLTFHRVPYDHESAGFKIRAANLPQRLAARLEDGH